MRARSLSATSRHNLENLIPIARQLPTKADSAALEHLEPDSALDEERGRAALRGHEPFHSSRETQVIGEVIVQLGVIFEGERMPQSTAPPRSEELSAEHLPYRFVGKLIVRLRGPLGANSPNDAAPGAPSSHPRRDSRIRACVDEYASVYEDPVCLLEGIDHALARNASERPREDHHVERRVRQSQRLRGSFAELHVRNAEPTGFGPAASERAAIGVDGKHRIRYVSGTEREPAFARADVGNAKTSEIDAVRAQLDFCGRP